MLTAILVTAHALSQNTATTPAHRLSEDWWKERHELKVQTTQQASFDIAFIGASIFQFFQREGELTWNKDYAPLKMANFGFSGDRTEHVLWRLQNGEVLGANPKLIILQIGNNNNGANTSTPAETAQGVRLIVKTLRQNLPKAKILLLAIFPRGTGLTDPLTAKNYLTNDLTLDLAQDPNVTWLDINAIWLRSNGNLRTLLMPDGLHPNADGYEVWSKAMLPTVKHLLNSP